MKFHLIFDKHSYLKLLFFHIKNVVKAMLFKYLRIKPLNSFKSHVEKGVFFKYILIYYWSHVSMHGIYENVMLSTLHRVTFLISILHIHTTYFFLNIESSVIYVLSVRSNLMFAVDHKICRSFNVSYNSCFFSGPFFIFIIILPLSIWIHEYTYFWENKFVYIIHICWDKLEIIETAFLRSISCNLINLLKKINN